jgi:hypothetical protein
MKCVIHPAKTAGIKDSTVFDETESDDAPLKMVGASVPTGFPEGAGAGVGVVAVGCPGEAADGASVGYGARLPSSAFRIVHSPPSGSKMRRLPLPTYVPVIHVQAESQVATLPSMQLKTWYVSEVLPGTKNSLSQYVRLALPLQIQSSQPDGSRLHLGLNGLVSFNGAH